MSVALAACGGDDGSAGGGGDDPVTAMTSCIERAGYSIHRNQAESRSGVVADLDVEGNASSSEVKIFNSDEAAMAYTGQFLDSESLNLFEQRGPIVVVRIDLDETEAATTLYDELVSCADAVG